MGVLTMASWLHNIDPFAIQITSGFGIRWYGLSYAAGFVVGWLLLRWLSGRGATPLSHQRLADALVLLMLGVVVGGRVGYVLVYDQSLLTSFRDGFPWWGVLRLNEGGMASHGGMIGVIVATWYIARGPKDQLGLRTQRTPWLHVMDLCALVSTPGLLFGRLANFINGELLGKIVAAPGEPGPGWAVRFPQERLDSLIAGLPLEAGHGHTPALLPEQALRLSELLAQYRLPSDDNLQAFERVLHVLQSGTPAAARDVAAKLGPLIASRHPSQLYQAGAEGLLLGGVLMAIWFKARKPGVITAWFLIVYGVMRVVTEFWRLPDANLDDPRPFGFSRGQWLSVLMVVCGAAVLFACSRRKAAPMGGWGRVKPLSREPGAPAGSGPVA